MKVSPGCGTRALWVSKLKSKLAGDGAGELVGGGENGAEEPLLFVLEEE